MVVRLAKPYSLGMSRPTLKIVGRDFWVDAYAASGTQPRSRSGWPRSVKMSNTRTL